MTGIESIGTDTESASGTQKGMLRAPSKYSSDMNNNYTSSRQPITSEPSTSVDGETLMSHEQKDDKENPGANTNDIYQRITDWTNLNKLEMISGFVVSISSVPELIAAAILAGLPAYFGLTTAWIFCFVTSLMGGGRGLISGVTPAIAIALIGLMQSSGLGYVTYATLFASLFQFAFGILRIGKLLRLIPYPVMVGFLNSTALIIIFSQLMFFKDPNAFGQGQSRPYYEGSYHINAFASLVDGAWVSASTIIVMSIEAALTFAIALGLPRITKAIPSALVALIAITGLEWGVVRMVGYSGALVGDIANIETPIWPIPFFLSDSYILPPLNMDTFVKVLPTGLSVFFIAQMESLLVFKHIRSINQEGEFDANLVATSQGVGQFLASFCGGMAGSTSIAQSVILRECGGLSNSAPFFAAVFLFGISAGAYTAVSIVPLGYIVGINVFAAFNLVNWKDFMTILAALFPLQLRDRMYLDSKVNRFDTIIMLVVFTMTFFFDAAFAAVVGIVLAVFEYAWECSTRIEIEKEQGIHEESVSYRVKGNVFFATANKLIYGVSSESIAEDPREVIILMENAEVLDWTGMLALKSLHDRLHSSGKDVAISSLTPATKALMEKSSEMWSGVVFLEVQDLFDGESTVSSKKGFA
eukprot:CAMPEP_0172419552 /NCGR_PEP_ID=MMETSP1064-20121228/5971_1 /TAXON_ID=202472 /ORGANISM="Aulacoseira subarctica , Strain CCAP 1002/5" /LENGTH=642 /DNA_ID=CAMNT_0013159087 /DNA_START=143 /DNA_END=2071 /DNA_ORIENTATION=-